MDELISLTTYPPTMSDYENEVENANYDNEVRSIVVPRKWAEAFVTREFGVTFDDFLRECTWDETFQMYEAAEADGVLVMTEIRGRMFGD